MIAPFGDKMIASNIQVIKQKLPPTVTLVAVSKFHAKETIMEAYHAGQRHFGESRAQELMEKRATLPADMVWHFIGPLQTNKVKMVVGKAALIHSIDSERLLWAVEKEALKQGVEQPCLLEFHIATEESKSGFTQEEVAKLISTSLFSDLKAVKINGVMGMASFVSDAQQIRTEFRRLKQYFDQLKQSVFPNAPDFCHLSMGMSGDWPIAIEEGSTLVRIGTQIFGVRADV